MNTTIETLTKWVNQRPGLEFANYGDVSAYRSEMAEITRDRTDYFELLSLAFRRIGDKLEEQLKNYFESNPSQRLVLSRKGQLEYTVGQYFPTEYRQAANIIIKHLIWQSYANELDGNNNPVYMTGGEIRKAIKRNVSRRVMRNYFS